EQRGDRSAAENYYDLAMRCEGACDDFGLPAEYLGFLSKGRRYEKLWQIYSSLPDNCKNADRVKIFAAVAAVKLDQLGYLEAFFAEEHYDIREGETSLTDIWFEFCARRMAKERGIQPLSDTALDALIDEAWDTCPPDPEIDFRMSFDKKNRYRVQ
ncbi:MAG: hypothetical protein IJY04_08220, partial [Clostridia bacterium]|nr:hypothetical protein [Clostridia bacterium]